MAETAGEGSGAEQGVGKGRLDRGKKLGQARNKQTKDKQTKEKTRELLHWH
ncbi:hypothetical protein [Brevibacillus parabrevis]|uniref:Uncharacterized protein n=1 Tax=Brevibacillus parabrevis TaxID=54914 RepID=A0A4Y3PTM4_BREPA|nr:hypothetical protein [Brevibacillus parabrevis]WDV93647.1 hypothetical protein PSE45_18555 [Brevibacillus parabrevis]GEB34738.1 hypothetical protein BPA01_43180 [Brevibacillus parabrevis]